MAKHASPQSTFYRICQTCEKTQLCSCCNNRKEQNRFSAAVWERPRGGGRVCLDCSSKAWSRWSCSLCAVKQPAFAYETWMAQHRSLRGRQESGGTGSCNAGEGSTEGCRRKKTRIVADIWAAIAERKRKREQDSAQRHEAAPHAKQRREDDRTEITTDRHAEMSCRQQTDASATEKVTLPAKEAKAARKGKSFQYVCPACQKFVRSSIRTGQANHRRACGNLFQVRDAQVVAKAYAYVCPACKGNVTSDMKTGQINHRTVCGNQFSVKDGVVKDKAYVYVCPACKGNVPSNVKTGQIDHRTVCGNQFSVKDGVVKEKAYVYVCPACKGNVPSNVKTGQIDHRTVCGSQFSVKDGVVKEKGGKRHA